MIEKYMYIMFYRIDILRYFAFESDVKTSREKTNYIHDDAVGSMDSPKFPNLAICNYQGSVTMYPSADDLGVC